MGCVADSALFACSNLAAIMNAGNEPVYFHRLLSADRQAEHRMALYELPEESSELMSLTGNETDPLISEASSSLTSTIPRKKGTELPSKDYDSLDYDVCYNVPYKSMIRDYRKRTYYHMQLMRWVMVGIIGFLTGIVAFLIDISVKELFKLKYGFFDKVYNSTFDQGRVVLGFLVLLGINCLFGAIASFLITLEPVAAGSGIPEIKCYLNGVKVPHVTRLTTLFSKAIGVLFSVAGGFLVGKEGPMIHSGAIIGAGVSQFRSMFCKFINLPYHYFRSDRDKRDFVSSGAAAGVAAAFGAPIGGVLFSLEEGSSFWNQSLTWRTLFCSFCSTFALNLFLSATTGLTFGLLGAPSLVDFGVFNTEEKRLWNAYHLIIFIAMGVGGGLFGALFNYINTRITEYRMMYLHRRRRAWRIGEAILIAAVTTTAVFIAAMLLGTCVPEDTSAIDKAACRVDRDDPGVLSFRNETKHHFCPPYGNSKATPYYNDMATLLFNSQETAIKQLFHQTGAFTLPTLGILFIVYFLIACWTYGASIPSGLFIPTLLIGAAYGRFVAIVLKNIAHAVPALRFLTNLYPGTYALIGAASFLGGVVRMTISLTVILIESTNEIDYGLPIMLTLMVAKWVGDIFNEGLYDIHIEIKQTPLLGWAPPYNMDRLNAADVMNPTLRYMYPITRVHSVQRLLRTTVHSAFVIVTPVDSATIPERPHNVSNKHVPQLYTRKSFTGGGYGTTDLDSESDIEVCLDSASANPYSVNQGQTNYGTAVIYPHLGPESRLANLSASYTLPESSRGRGIQFAFADEEGPPKKLLLFHGIILRSQLVMLLKKKAFFPEEQGPEGQPEVSHLDLTAEYPRYPTIFDVQLSDAEKNMLMDLSLYMNPCPYTIYNQAPLPQVFNLFRTMGLRHLPVVRDSGIVVGIITRHDLTHERLHALLDRKKQLARENRQRNRETCRPPTDPLLVKDDDVFT